MTATLSTATRPWRARNRKIIQNSWVVPDIEAAMRHWVETTGVGPFFVVKGVTLDDQRYRHAAELLRLQELNRKTQSLIARMKEAAPKLKGDLGKEFREAQDRHHIQVLRMGGKIQVMQGTIDELTKKRSP